MRCASWISLREWHVQAAQSLSSVNGKDGEVAWCMSGHTLPLAAIGWASHRNMRGEKVYQFNCTENVTDRPRAYLLGCTRAPAFRPRTSRGRCPQGAPSGARAGVMYQGWNVTPARRCVRRTPLGLVNMLVHRVTFARKACTAATYRQCKVPVSQSNNALKSRRRREMQSTGM